MIAAAARGWEASCGAEPGRPAVAGAESGTTPVTARDRKHTTRFIHHVGRAAALEIAGATICPGSFFGSIEQGIAPITGVGDHQ